MAKTGGGGGSKQSVMGSSTSPSRSPGSGPAPNYSVNIESSQPPMGMSTGMGMSSGMGTRPGAMGQPGMQQPTFGQPGMGSGMNYRGGAPGMGYGSGGVGGGMGMGMQTQFGTGYGNQPGFGGSSRSMAPGTNPMAGMGGTGFQQQRQF